MFVLKVVWLCSLFYLSSGTPTHWMVTQNGLVQPKEPSQFLMANPYDLLAFLNQDIRWDNILNMYYDLASRRDNINTLWKKLETETDISSHISRNINCVSASPLKNIDWFTTAVDGVSRDVSDQNPITLVSENEAIEIPDCKKLSSLTFSMVVFEHLEAMIQRDNLTMNPDITLNENVSPMMSIEQLGHWLSGRLKRNTTSWLHYNMAALYWQIRGNAVKALECSRRATLYSSRKYRDMALYNMGIVFHKSKRTEDAITVLNAAVDHGPGYTTNHFVLANAYAVLGDYNSSLRHFDETLKINPNFNLARKHRSGLLCHKVLRKKMMTIQRYMKDLRRELTEFIEKETQWLKIQASFLRTMRHEVNFDYRNVEKNCEKMAELTGLNIKGLKAEGDKNSLILYFLDDPKYNEEWMTEKGVLAIEAAYTLERVIKHLERHATNIVSSLLTPTLGDSYRTLNRTIKAEIGPPPELLDFKNGDRSDLKDYIEVPYSRTTTEKPKTEIVENEPFEFEGGIVLYPSNMKVNRLIEDFDREPSWPSVKFCNDNAARFPKNLDLVYPVFLPFENKGIRLKSLLSDMIGVPVSAEHELPWHPPTCPQERDGFNAKKNAKSQMSVEVSSGEYLRVKLHEYVADGHVNLVHSMQDAEIGQRILTAIEAKAAPNWLLYTLASLYWRVRNNKANAANCLITATKSVPTRHKDIVYTSLASVYLEMGYFDDALQAAEEAFRCGVFEPATNFILAELNMVKESRKVQLFHLKQAVRVDPGFLGGVARTLLDATACKHSRDEEETVYEICAQVKVGVNMVCEQDGQNCHVTNEDCSARRDRKHRSALVRLLGSTDNAPTTPHMMQGLDYGFLQEIADSKPKRNTDKAAHALNFKRLRSSMDTIFEICRLEKCNRQLTEHLAITENDCKHQELMLGYWVHMGYKQILTDDKMALLNEISATVTKEQRIPDCSLPDDATQDFYLERMIKVDAEDWEPIMIFVDQLTEIFKVPDFALLGSKIATYVEKHPQSWGALEAAGWWCGAMGRGACAVRCLTRAAHAPPTRATHDGHATHAPHAHAARSLTALLHMQAKMQDAKEMAYLVFYISYEDQISAYLVALAHTYLDEYEEALWMYRYALNFGETFLAAKLLADCSHCRRGLAPLVLSLSDDDICEKYTRLAILALLATFSLLAVGLLP